jgi:hypothetical protein
MTGSEIITILLCLVSVVVLILMAWWVSEINTVLVRLAVAFEARHLECSAERAAEKRIREVRQKHFFQWLAETACTLNGLRGIAEKFTERRDNLVMTSPPQSPAAPASEPMPPTVKPSRQAASALPSPEANEDLPRESDADTLCWAGPGSSRTLVGVGVTELDEPQHGPARAQQLAEKLRKSQQ